jgi:YHS domain-containing protein
MDYLGGHQTPSSPSWLPQRQLHRRQGGIMKIFCVALRRPIPSVIALVAAILFGYGDAQAVKQTGGEYNTLHAGLGAEGYDPVAYFTDRRAVHGKSEFEAVYGGVTWRFATADHRDLFEADPAKYAPQYGGFCAWGVAQGKLFDVDPVDGWRIVDGKLYMNFNKDILDLWQQDLDGNLSKAEANWPTLNR